MTDEKSIGDYSIFCLKKNNDIEEMAIVNSSNDIITQKPLHNSIIHLSEYFNELYQLMCSQENNITRDISQTKKYTFTNNEYIIGTIYHRVFMRKGSYYYVIQKSERGVRFLLYAINRVHHSSVALGSYMRLPKKDEQLIEMREKLMEIYINGIKELNFFQTIDLTNEINLINNNSLYFL